MTRRPAGRMRRRSSAGPPAVLEAELADALERALRALGPEVLWYHTHDSRRSQPGFPDYFVVAGGHSIAIELKREGGIVTDAQRAWLAGLARAGVYAILAVGASGTADAIRVIGHAKAGRRIALPPAAGPFRFGP